MNAKLARYGGCESALHEGVNLATFFVGQTVIAFGHMCLRRCGVPREDSPHLGTACHNMKSVAGEKDGLRVLATCIAAGELCALPPPFPQPLCSAHVVYASLLHFGVETAEERFPTPARYFLGMTKRAL